MGARLKRPRRSVSERFDSRADSTRTGRPCFRSQTAGRVRDGALVVDSAGLFEHRGEVLEGPALNTGIGLGLGRATAVRAAPPPALPRRERRAGVLRRKGPRPAWRCAAGQPGPREAEAPPPRSDRGSRGRDEGAAFERRRNATRSHRASRRRAGTPAAGRRRSSRSARDRRAHVLVVGDRRLRARGSTPPRSGHASSRRPSIAS